MEHWNIACWKSLVGEWLSLFQSFAVKSRLKSLRELFDILRHIIIRLHLLGSHRFGMELNLGLRKIAVFLGQRLRVLSFFWINLCNFSFYLLLSWLDGLKFSFNLILAGRRCHNFCNLLSMLHLSNRFVFHFKQRFALKHFLDILFGLLLVIFAQVFVDGRNHFLSLLALGGQNLDLLGLNGLVLHEDRSDSRLDQRRSGVIKNRSNSSILLSFDGLGLLKLQLHALQGFHWVFSLSFVMLSLQLYKLLLLLFGLLLVLFSLFGFKFGHTHGGDAYWLFLNCWHRFLAVVFGVRKCGNIWPISNFLSVRHS